MRLFINSSNLINPKIELKLKSLINVVLVTFFVFFSTYVTYKYVEFNPNLNFTNTSSKVYDANGVLLWEISENNSVRRTPIPLSQMSKYCIEAIVAVEDKSFWYNIGVDERGLVRLFLSLFSSGSFGGGSTISQQLIKNANNRILDRNISDKLTEIIQAIKLNSVLTKEEILESYLNNIYFGNLNYGIESAANEYFGKCASDLNQLECAYLMGIPQRPGIFNPYANLTLGLERKDGVLQELYRANYISEQELFELKEKELFFSNRASLIKAPHYIDFLHSQLKELSSSEREIYSDKKFLTSYDYDLHTRTLEIAIEVVSEYYDINNASVIVIDKYGNLKTMLGSVDYFDDEISGKFNSSLGLRQPTMLWAPIYLKHLETSENYNDESYYNYPLTYTRRIKFDKPYYTKSIYPQNKNSNSLTLSQALELSEAIPLTNSLNDQLVLEFIRSDIFKLNLSTKELDSLVSRCDKYLFLEGCEIRLFDLVRIYWTFLTENNSVTTIPNMLFLSDDNKKLNELKSFEYSSKDVNNMDYFAVKSNGSYLVLVWVGNTSGRQFDTSHTKNPALVIARKLIP